MNERTFIPALRNYLQAPPHVSIGASWRAIKNQQGKTDKWEDRKAGTIASPQALHIEIDSQYYTKYANNFALLWKKHAKKSICCLKLRLVPCFKSPTMNVADDQTKSDAVNMALKQQHLINHHIARLTPCSFIAFLDRPLSKNPDNSDSDWTLRRFLMKASPEGFPAKRLFITVDQCWDGRGFQLVTTKPFAREAEIVLNNMIPECLHTYGAPSAKWFTNSGLEAYKGIIWDHESRRTSSKNHEIHHFVEEDFFDMGDNWKPGPTITTRTETLIASLNPAVTAATVQSVLDSRNHHDGARTDQSVASFGNRLGRDHDGDTVKTTAPNAEPTPSTSLRPSTVQLLNENGDLLTGMEITHPDRDDGDSLSMSTMAKTTESTRRNLKSTAKQVAALTIENEKQDRKRKAAVKKANALEQEAIALKQELDNLRLLLASSSVAPSHITPRPVITPPTTFASLTTPGPSSYPPSAAHGGPSDTEAAGVGHYS
jgi:hypothetical protein